MTFPREKYYSQTDVIKKYKISATKYQKLLQDKKIETLRIQRDMGGYTVNILYVEKDMVDALNLPKRPF